VSLLRTTIFLQEELNKTVLLIITAFFSLLFISNCCWYRSSSLSDKVSVYKVFPVTYFRSAAVLVRKLFAPGRGDVPGIHALVLYAGAGLVFLALSCTIGCRDFNILKYMFCQRFPANFFDFFSVRIFEFLPPKKCNLFTCTACLQNSNSWMDG
jgi:hypothetical protein